MATNTIIVEISVPRWRVWLMRAALRVACALDFVAPNAAARIGEAAARFATRGLRVRER